MRVVRRLCRHPANKMHMHAKGHVPARARSHSSSFTYRESISRCSGLMKVASLLILLCKCSSRLSDTSVLNTLETITRERAACKRRVTEERESVYVWGGGGHTVCTVW